MLGIQSTLRSLDIVLGTRDPNGIQAGVVQTLPLYPRAWAEPGRSLGQSQEQSSKYTFSGLPKGRHLNENTKLLDGFGPVLGRAWLDFLTNKRM